MNKKQIIKWTEEDKAKLVEQVQTHTQNKRTSWNQVSLAMNRTPNQCKTYYTIVIKQLEPKQVNMKWDLDEFIRLITTVSIYGKKWELIRKLEFNNYTAEQLRQKYLFFENKKNMRAKLIENITKNNDVSKAPEIFKKNIDYLMDKINGAENNLYNIDLKLVEKAFSMNNEQFDIKQLFLKMFELMKQDKQI
ncbi:Conserved_hypothetical protein [Hexamita inflata]|uniref:Myb-like DNA-binding domain-containing protein n=1 Tax=Hexamita inflata TaxID=28002 RepID=A0AA86TQG5_9EUKA|nr:Conserved hypothetical protein [Hexamita inflata]